MLAFFQKILAFFLSVLAFLGLVRPQPPQTESYTVNGNAVEFRFDANPTTGYGWTAAVDGDCVTLTKDEYVQDPAVPGMAGVGGTQYYSFAAVHAGEATVTFTYARSWETTDADRTVTATIRVAADNTVSVSDYKEL